MSNIKDIEDNILAEISKTNSLQDLQEVKIKELAKKSRVTTTNSDGSFFGASLGFWGVQAGADLREESEAVNESLWDAPGVEIKAKQDLVFLQHSFLTKSGAKRMTLQRAALGRDRVESEARTDPGKSGQKASDTWSTITARTLAY